MFFAGGVGDDFDFAELGFEEAGGYGAVFEGEGVEVEVGIDVAVGVEDVFAETFGAAGADIDPLPGIGILQATRRRGIGRLPCLRGGRRPCDPF